MTSSASEQTAIPRDVQIKAGSPPSERMQCMEVWGGNQGTNRHLEMTGLETWIFSEPHQSDQSGGDVYYVSSCASGRVTRLLLADVSGHGEDASTPAVGLRELMRQNVNIIKPTSFVQTMNKQFAKLDRGRRFATAVVCSFFSPTSRMTLCNAGHPEPLYRTSKGPWVSVSQQSQELDTNDFPLGIMDDTDYSQITLSLKPGDMLMLFSDAFIEAVGRDGELVGAGGLLGLVNQLDASEPGTLIPQLIAELRKRNPDNLSTDDATVLVVRATGTKPSLKDNLMAPFRFFRPVEDRTELDGES